MSYSYESNSITSDESFLVALSNFLYSVGWTINAQTTRELYVSSLGEDSLKSLYFGIRLVDNTSPDTKCMLQIVGNTGYDSFSDWESQPGQPKSIITSNPPYSVGISLEQGVNNAYYIMGNKDFIALVINPISDYFQHMCFGSLKKSGSYSGGNFYTGSNYIGNSSQWDYTSTTYATGYLRTGTPTGNYLTLYAGNWYANPVVYGSSTSIYTNKYYYPATTAIPIVFPYENTSQGLYQPNNASVGGVRISENIFIFIPTTPVVCLGYLEFVRITARSGLSALSTDTWQKEKIRYFPTFQTSYTTSTVADQWIAYTEEIL